MGMSSSQLRLLSITSRLHTIGNQMGRLEAEEMALATKSDQIYEEYNLALNAKNIQVGTVGADAKTTYENISYENLCNFNECRTTQYALKDNKTGLALVSEDIKQMYDRFGASKYTFAYAMVGYSDDMQLQEQTNSAGIGYKLTAAELQIIADNQGDTKLQELYTNVQNAQNDSEMKDCLNELRKYMYDTNNKNYGKEIFNMTNPNPDVEWADVQPEFDYYARLYEFIEQCGGCKVVESQYESGEEGEKWLNYQISCGNISINVFSDNTKKEWQATTVSSSAGKNYLKEASNDALEKAAKTKYEHQLDLVKREEKRVETQLNSLETEQNALEKLSEQYKTFIQDNIKRHLANS